MVLGRGDKGDAVKQLQRALNRLGSILLVDGDFGAGTEAAVADARVALGLPGPATADDLLLDRLRALPEPSVELTAPGVTFIAREEVSSPAEYRRRFKNPVWPTLDSGITIGIGYDLQFSRDVEFRADWSRFLSPATLDRFRPALLVKGSEDLLARVIDVEVPLPAAVTVFLGHMMPKHIGITRGSYPMLDRLAPARRTALISLVFNRGGKLSDEPRRAEMKRVRELLEAGGDEDVAAQFEAMTRHFDPTTERGVIERRRREATLWRAGFSALDLD